MAKLGLWIAAGVLLLLAAGIAALIFAGPGGIGGRLSGHTRQATNMALDVRYTYDSRVFRPAPYDAAAEFPLRLDAAGMSFYGKRLAGIGAWLGREPGSLLYDFVGSQQAEAFEGWYGLKPLDKPVYEDARLGGKLGLHQLMAYELGATESAWPAYFPDSVKGGTRAYIEGWAMFSEHDLFYFYAVSGQPLSAVQRQACVQVINSLEFDALLGGAAPPAAPQQPPQNGAPPQSGEQPPAGGGAENKVPAGGDGGS